MNFNNFNPPMQLGLVPDHLPVFSHVIEMAPLKRKPLTQL